MLTSHRSEPHPLSSSGPTFPALCPATARTVPVAVVASALCPDHRGLPSYGISVEWKEGSGGAGPVALPERPRGPEGALGVPTSASAPERDSTQGLLPVSTHKIPFHGTAEPLVCQDAARETLVHVINLLATPFPRGQALEERSGGRVRVRNKPQMGGGGRATCHPCDTLSRGASELAATAVARAGGPRVPVA